MTNSIAFPHCWTDMPNPRIEGPSSSAAVAIELHETDWRKIVSKHFASSKEPWGEVLSSKVVDALAGRSPTAIQDCNATRTALAAIHDQIGVCLQRPLVILYSCIGEQVRGQGHRWLLILPCGAIAVAWTETLKNRLKTCYFTGSAAVKPKGDRWKHALRQHVQEYATFDEVSRTFVYPSMKDRREVSNVGTAAELRYATQFSTPEAWGFESNIAGSPWRRPSWEWLAPEHAALSSENAAMRLRKDVTS